MIFASPYPDVQIPSLGVYDLVLGSLTDDDRARVALIDGKSGATTTFGELDDQVCALAGALAARGVGRGDVVALLAPNSSAFVLAFFAVLRAGGTVTTVNALFTAPEIGKQLRASEASMMITVSPLLDAAETAWREQGLPDAGLIVLDGPGESGPGGHPNAAELIGMGAVAPDVQCDPENDLAVLPYSSGTTGEPKGVKITHTNLVANVCQIRVLLGVNSDDTVLAVLPFFHIYGLTVLLHYAMLQRARLVVLPRFDLTDFLGAIARHRVSFVPIAPPVAVALAKHPAIDDFDMSSVRVVMSGAASLDAELGAAVATRLNCVVLQGYGMSELSPVSHVIPADGGAERNGEPLSLSSTGWAVPNTENKLVAPDSGEVIGLPADGERSERGELWVRGPNVMAGYLGNDAATAATIDDDGFLHTGDIAEYDHTGAIYIVDRLKELIKYKGYQVPPAELEALLLTHPGIADAAVIGVAESDTGEEVPKAFVVRQADSEVTAEEVMEFVASRVAPYKKVREVEFIEAVPKSAAGKILRKQLRAPQ